MKIAMMKRGLSFFNTRTNPAFHPWTYSAKMTNVLIGTKLILI